ncbi:hypothetical protein GPJ56_005064 [Histomonas meleagridis]|uniref:uncharacterized protein n=1 Tax=Histomonas meleagridis TaxID=135588 RepID=UPI003559BE67|nr:hypothetical protein GPJ56_005064 [Histomonas meleagridis]KAH0802581.1 hypothetical protein GO595_004630 [Histomonas meleagridis]
MDFEDQTYVVIPPYLYKITPKQNEITFKCVDENLDIFNHTSLLLPGKGILTLDKIRSCFSLYNPITHQLYNAKLDFFSPNKPNDPMFLWLYSIALLTNERIAVISTCVPNPKANAAQLQTNVFENTQNFQPNSNQNSQFGESHFQTSFIQTPLNPNLSSQPNANQNSQFEESHFQTSFIQTPLNPNLSSQPNANQNSQFEESHFQTSFIQTPLNPNLSSQPNANQNSQFEESHFQTSFIQTPLNPNLSSQPNANQNSQFEESHFQTSFIQTPLNPNLSSQPNSNQNSQFEESHFQTSFIQTPLNPNLSSQPNANQNSQFEESHFQTFGNFQFEPVDAFLPSPDIRRVTHVANVSDVSFVLSDYVYTKPLLVSSCTQYTPTAKDGLKEIINANHQMYYPIPPFQNYRVTKGFGDIPTVFKSSNFTEASQTEILTQIGAPVFLFCKEAVYAGSVAESSLFKAVSEYVNIQIHENLEFPFLRPEKLKLEDIKWIGIVEYEKQDLTGLSSKPKWKLPIPDKYIEVNDEEAIVAMDPLRNYSSDELKYLLRVTNCLGGKWIPQADIDDQNFVKSLIFVHENYQNVINEIPKFDIYESHPMNLNGFEICGSVGVDAGMVTLVTNSHLFNLNDIDNTQSGNRFGEYLVKNEFIPYIDGNDEESLAKNELSKLYSLDFSDSGFVKFKLFPGGATAESGGGDGEYYVLAKRVDGKAVCIAVLFY